MKVYVASSWRNPHYERTLAELRDSGFDPYDFKDPKTAFNWREAVPLEERVSGTDGKPKWKPDVALAAIRSPVAAAGFSADFGALLDARMVVLLLPAGSSAHLEAGYAWGMGKPVHLYVPEAVEALEPELMWMMFEPACRSMVDLLSRLQRDAKALAGTR